MPLTASASGTINEDSYSQPHAADPASHWLSDPAQLTHWQVQLVDCCHAINQQLTEIRSELTENESGSAGYPSIPFRLYRESLKG